MNKEKPVPTIVRLYKSDTVLMRKRARQELVSGAEIIRRALRAYCKIELAQ